MARTAKGPFIELPEEVGPKTGPLYRRLATRLREMIISGALPAGHRLPSTRQMAADLKCSRNTVATAIEYLDAEGYIFSRRGAGTFIAERPHQDRPQNTSPKTSTKNKPDHTEPQFSAYLHTMTTARPSRHAKSHTFSRQPDVSSFPFDLWAKIYRKTWENPSEALIRDEDPMGHLPLRQAIAEHLSFWRGLACSAEQIMVTAGTTQALHFLARLLLNKGDTCWVEEPGFLEAKSALKSVEAVACPIPTDEDGIHVTSGIEKAPSAKAVFITPSHQHPLGHVLSMARREELLNWAYKAGAWVIEDDHDAEIRHKGGVQPALKSMDSGDHVIYVGTFSKILFQSLRIGFLVLPQRLVEPAKTIRSYTELCPSIIMQSVLASFIQDGHFISHLRRSRVLYDKKMAFFLKASREILSGFLEIKEDPIGTHVVGFFKNSMAHMYSDKIYSKRLLEKGVNATPLSDYYSHTNSPQGFVFGYGSASETEVMDGLNIIRQTFSEE